MKTVTYVRVSTDHQQTDAQKSAIREYVKKHGINVDIEKELTISSRKSTKARKINELLELLETGDTLIVAELSRLGRSVGQVLTILDELTRKKVRLISIKEKIDIPHNGEKDIHTKILITFVSLFAEIERDLISMRTREGLAAARAKGKQLGRPKNALSGSRFDQHRKYIEQAVKMGVPTSVMMKKIGCSRTGLEHYIKTRRLKK